MSEQASPMDPALPPQMIPETTQAQPSVQPIPVKGNFWIGVVYFFLFLSVYSVYGSVNALLTQAVNFLLHPETVSKINSYLNAANKIPITSIIIFYPLFLGLFVYLRTQIAKNPEIRNFKVRKTFFYLTIVVSLLYILTILFGTVLALVSEKVNTDLIVNAIAQLLILAPIPTYLILEVKGSSVSVMRDTFFMIYVTLLTVAGLIYAFLPK